MGCTALRLVVCGCVCAFVCICVLQKSNAEYRLVLGPSCFSMLQEAQSGRTRGSLAALAPVTHEAAQWDGSYWGVGVKLMTWCVTETHHLSVIQVFELQGCNVARLVWKDLFQIAGPEGSVAVHVGGCSAKKWHFSGCGCNETTCKNQTVEAEKR